MNIYAFWEVEALKIMDGLVVDEVIPSFKKLTTRATKRIKSENTRVLTEDQREAWKTIIDDCMIELAQYSASRGFEWSKEYMYYHGGIEDETFIEILLSLTAHDSFFNPFVKREEINIKRLKVSLSHLENRVNELRMMSKNEVVLGDMDSEYRVITEILVSLIGFSSTLGLFNVK